MHGQLDGEKKTGWMVQVKEIEWVFLCLTATDKWNMTEVIRFAGTSRLVMINIFKGGATIKRDLNRLEEQARRTPIKFRMDKCEVISEKEATLAMTC